jgi:nucleotide-binding universal stress UspA family protein
METILCPTDFSASSQNAIRYADELAARMNTRLVLFHNITAPVSPQGASPASGPPLVSWQDRALEEEKQVKLEALKKALENRAGDQPVQYKAILRHGILRETVPQIAREEKADLIVMSHEGAESLQQVFVGSVAEALIKEAPCPVLIVPPKAVFKPLNKIVFTTDLRGEPFVDVQWVLKLGALFDAEILFVHVMSAASASYQAYAEDELHRIYKSLPYQKVTFYKEQNTSIEEGISQFCRRHKADLLVMGYHPKSLWQHLFAASHAQEMAYHTFLPLLVIHYKE